MIQRAIPISNLTKAVIVAGALSLLAAPAMAQTNDKNPDVEELARTPLEDFNIDNDDLPEVLVIAARDPYDSEGLGTCNDIVRQIAMLDTVLGADFDIAGDDEGGLNRSGIAKSIVGSFIPFRGIVREVSGANKRRREFNLAVTAGMVRRGFLKGLGQQRGCNYPASPRENRGTLTVGE